MVKSAQTWNAHLPIPSVLASAELNTPKLSA
jgi:hypothetical protein